MEFPTLGQNCSKKDCNQLDFLPAPCTHCRNIFCAEHLSPFIHECQEFKDNLLSDKELEGREKEKWQIKCSLSSCKVKDLLPMRCSKCLGHFCLNHRHEDQHGCAPHQENFIMKKEEFDKKKKVVQAGKEQQDKVKEEISLKIEEAKGAGGAKGVMARKLALMKLKGRAKGDGAVPIGDRVFFSVDCPNKEQNPKALDVWMSKTWTMGKAIDFMAKQARIKNRNNVHDAPKLHIYKEDNCISKPTDKCLVDLLEEGVIVDGDALEFKLLPPEDT